jgi:tricarballylate dehydrogenase
MRVTDGRADPLLADLLIGRSYGTIRWMADLGIKMEPAVSLSAIKVGDTLRWSPGAVIRAQHEGIGLSRMWFDIAAKRKVEVRYGCCASQLRQDHRGRVTGVVVQDADGAAVIGAKAVVLACGGFEANTEWRARYLGAPWDSAKVRGTRYNTGDGLKMAFEAGALAHGQWTGCHSTPIDADAPPFGDRKLTDKSNRLSYPLGIMLNREGRRFVDEGEDFQFYTYAKMGGIILKQPGGVAWQIFDSKVTHLLEGRYKTGTPIVADTLEAVIARLPLNQDAARESVARYQAAAAATGGRFDPAALDGMGTRGLAPDKSHWAQPLDTPPYVAYPATGGITFTFGGVRIDEGARVLHSTWQPLPGLFACGEMVGGLFHGNYPGGSGLVSGAVFGRIAGASAAEHASAQA